MVTNHLCIPSFAITSNRMNRSTVQPCTSIVSQANRLRQVEVDWAGDPATIIGPDTGEIIKAYIFVGVMTYSQYAYVEAFLDMKQKSWINAHVHMYEFFGGVVKILVPDNY